MNSKMRYLLGGAVVVIAALLAAWWFLLRDDAPEEVSLAGALDTTTTSATPTTGSTSAGQTSLDGTWSVDASREIFVGYRVDEELANLGFATAVGRTSAVTGTLEFESNSIASASIEADLTQLRSNSNGRDNQMRRQALETDDFPTATFVLADPISLAGQPQEGVSFTAEAVGDLTIHGVTNRVTIPLEGQLIDPVTAVVVGSIPILFADYGINSPSAAIVLSVEDNGIMELQLFFRRPG